MPRSSRHKSHRQSKHSSRDARERSDSEENVKMKDRNGKEEDSVRVSRDLGLNEKRKLSLSKYPSGQINGDASDDFVPSKRRKEKADVSASSDRWNGGGDERGIGGSGEKEMKGDSSRIDADKSSKLTSVDSKNKSSRRHESGSEKKEENVGLSAEKEESMSGSRVDSKRKSEKDSGQKDERGRERKMQDVRRDTESRSVDGEATRKQASHSVDFGEQPTGKRSRENTEWSIQDELRNPELEKELEKRIRKRSDGSYDGDKYQDDVKESEDRRLSSRGDRAKDGRYKDETDKDGNCRDKHRKDGDRDNRNRDVEYLQDGQRESRHRDIKYREDGDNRHKDDKHHEDSEKDNRHGDNKYREDGRDNWHKDNKYRQDGDKDNRRRVDKYREGGDRYDRHRDEKHCEDGDREDRHRDDWFPEDDNRDGKNREEKNWEDTARDSRHRDGKQRDASDKDKRLRDVKYQDERSLRDRTSDKSDIKRLRDESNAAEPHYKKSSNRDGNPICDDRSTRYKNDKGKRRTIDKEGHGDIRSRSTKEHHSDTSKKSMNSARSESVSDRGRSCTRNADVEINPSHSRRRRSLSSSSHGAKDHCRPPQLEESKYTDYVHEEKVQLDVNSNKDFSGVTEKALSSQSIEKSFQKDYSHLGELSAERHLNLPRTSPLQLVDQSPSSTGTDRRFLNRSNVRRSLDIEDSGKRSGLKDAKDYSRREHTGSRELPMETLPGNEFSQTEGDNLSVCSPFTRTNNLPSNSRSLLPPPPSRMGVDSPLALGSLEDDNRSRSNSRHRRTVDPNVARVQGSAWRGIPNWPSPVANGFIPFQHGPPPVGFHPMMQQFPAPPLFSVRPPMELNQSGVHYHASDGDRFSGHGHPLGWRNPVDDSCPPSIHVWDANNAVLGDKSHIYGRLDWDQSRSLSGGRVWGTSGDICNGQNSGASTELPSQKEEDFSVRGASDEVQVDQSGLLPENGEKQPSVLAESIDIDQLSNACERNALESAKTIPVEMSNLLRNSDTCLSHVYLSLIDVSADLTQPELYSQYTNLMGVDQKTNSEEDDFKFIFVEEVIDAELKIPNRTSNASLFSTINDSVFQKAMSLYRKLGEDFRYIHGDQVPVSNVENLESAPILDREGVGSYDDKPGKVVPARDKQQAEAAPSALNEVKMELSPAITSEKMEEQVVAESLEKLESVAALRKVKMELDSVSEQETQENVVEDKSLYPENVEKHDAHSPGKADEVSRASYSKGEHCATDKHSPGKVEEVVCRDSDSKDYLSETDDKGQKLQEAKCGALLFCDVSSEACLMPPESLESGLVNLSRIHQSPESTH